MALRTRAAMAYASIQGHRSMVFDDVRNRAYYRALQALITPESVVLDLGAGLGILGLMAARLGARKVYLVEPSPVLNVAKMLVAGNEFGDRVECLPGRIEKVALPEQVDIIISVFTGNFLLLEDLLPSLFYARDHYLKPSGHLVPSAGVMKAAPVFLPRFHRSQIQKWSQPYFDLSMEQGRSYAANSLYFNRRTFGKPHYLAKPQELKTLDFQLDNDTNCNAKIEFRADRSGLCHALAGWFKMKLGDEWLSTAPHDPKVHWSSVLLPCDPPIPLAVGDRLKLALSRPPKGSWTWKLDGPGGRQIKSTFNGSMLSAKARARASVLEADHKPQLSARKTVMVAILALFDGKRSIDDIVEEVLALPQCSLARPQLLRLVRSLAQ